jgi:hypothetical protein
VENQTGGRDVNEAQVSFEMYRARYQALAVKKELFGEDALKAVERNGYALQYVKEQTEAVCLKAVERNGDALRYVEARWFAAEMSESSDGCAKAGI